MSKPYLSINYELGEPESWKFRFKTLETYPNKSYTLDINGVGEPVPVTYEQAMALVSVLTFIRGKQNA